MFSALVLAAVMSSPARYHGPPDLALTAAVVEAGGGAQHFSSRKLFVHLAGHQDLREGFRLTREYGVHDMAQFFATFNTFVDDALAQERARGRVLPHVAVPPANRLANQLYRAGIDRAGRYDVGYMIERLFSRPVHVAIMREVDANPHYGPAENARFHVILTRVIKDLHRDYPRG